VSLFSFLSALSIVFESAEEITAKHVHVRTRDQGLFDNDKGDMKESFRVS